MQKAAFAMAGAIAFCVAAGCRQQKHHHHSHDPSEHVADADQDLLPGRVKSAFAREFHGATIEDVEKQVHPDGAVHWEVRYRTPAGERRTAEFDTEGKLLPR